MGGEGTLRLGHFKIYFYFFYLDVGLWATRVATILFSLGYIIPIFGNPYQSYYKVINQSINQSINQPTKSIN